MNGEHLDHLVRGILDFEKLSTRERTPMIGSYRLAALLEQAILANSATVERFGAQHILENVDPVLTCDVDPQWYKRSWRIFCRMRQSSHWKVPQSPSGRTALRVACAYRSPTKGQT